MRGLVSDLLACMHHDSYLKSSRPALRSWGGARHGRSVGITSQPALVVTRVGTPTEIIGSDTPLESLDCSLEALPQGAPADTRC